MDGRLFSQDFGVEVVFHIFKNWKFQNFDRQKLIFCLKGSFYFHFTIKGAGFVKLCQLKIPADPSFENLNHELRHTWNIWRFYSKTQIQPIHKSYHFSIHGNPITSIVPNSGMCLSKFNDVISFPDFELINLYLSASKYDK